MPLVDGRTVFGRVIGGVDDVLHRIRNTVQRTGRGAARRLQRLLRIPGYERLDLAVLFLDAIKKRTGQLLASDFTEFQAPLQFRDRQLVNQALYAAHSRLIPACSITSFHFLYSAFTN